MSLKEKLSKLNSNGDAKEIFENREKGDIKTIFGQILTLRNFAILTNEEYGEYIAFIVDEIKDMYFLNGGQVMLTKFHEMEDYKDEIKQEGVPFKLIRITSSKHKKREYTDIILYPEDNDFTEINFDNDDLPLNYKILAKSGYFI